MTFPPIPQTVTELRNCFPALSRQHKGHTLSYLDNAATTLKPLALIETLSEFYRTSGANINRGSYFLGLEAGERFEKARATFADYLGRKANEVVFTKNATEALNIVASGLCVNSTISKGDTVVVSILEHHANLVPWQQLALRYDFRVVFCGATAEGSIDFNELGTILQNEKKVKVLALTQASNIIGRKNDLKKAATLAHQVGALIVVDGCQGAPHGAINLRELNIDFYALSAHKMCGPTGVGVLAGKEDLLEKLPPLLFGGSMISEVFKEKSSFQHAPARFEGGTPSVGDVLAAEAALLFLNSLPRTLFIDHPHALLAKMVSELQSISGITIVGGANLEQKLPILAFSVDGVHGHDIALFLDSMAVCVRTGDHCAQPLLRSCGIASAVRASIFCYNTEEDIDKLITGVKKAISVLR